MCRDDRCGTRDARHWHRRTESRDVQQPRVAEPGPAARPLHRVLGLGENGPAGRGGGVHERRTRAPAARAGDIRRAPRVLRRPPLLAQPRLPGAERSRLSHGGPTVRRPLPVGAHVLGVERGQPRLPADVQVSAPRRSVLPGAAPREPSPSFPSAGGRCAGHLEHAEVSAGLPPAGAGQATAVGAAQLPGRQPPYLRRHPPDAEDRAGQGLVDGDRRDRQVRPRVPLLGDARRAAHTLDVPSGRPLRHEAASPALQDHAPLRLQVARRRGAPRRGDRERGRHTPPGVLRGPEARPRGSQVVYLARRRSLRSSDGIRSSRGSVDVSRWCIAAATRGCTVAIRRCSSWAIAR